MLVVFVRTILLYFIILFVIRVMGKAELSKMSPFQLIVVFMIAELAAIPIESPEVSMITGVTAIFTLMFIQVLISFISLKSEKFKNFFSRKAQHPDREGQINHRELKSLRITIKDPYGTASAWETPLPFPKWNMPSWNPTAIFP